METVHKENGNPYQKHRDSHPVVHQQRLVKKMQAETGQRQGTVDQYSGERIAIP